MLLFGIDHFSVLSALCELRIMFFNVSIITNFRTKDRTSKEDPEDSGIQEELYPYSNSETSYSK